LKKPQQRSVQPAKELLHAPELGETREFDADHAARILARQAATKRTDWQPVDAPTSPTATESAADSSDAAHPDASKPTAKKPRKRGGLSIVPGT